MAPCVKMKPLSFYAGHTVMIAAKDTQPALTPEEYFVWEEAQLEKHEYIDGQVYVMGGG